MCKLLFVPLLLLMGCEPTPPRYEFRVEDFDHSYIVCISDSSGSAMTHCLTDRRYKTASEADAVAQQMNKAREENSGGNHP